MAVHEELLEAIPPERAGRWNYLKVLLALSLPIVLLAGEGLLVTRNVLRREVRTSETASVLTDLVLEKPPETFHLPPKVITAPCPDSLPSSQADLATLQSQLDVEKTGRAAEGLQLRAENDRLRKELQGKGTVPSWPDDRAKVADLQQKLGDATKYGADLQQQLGFAARNAADLRRRLDDTASRLTELERKYAGQNPPATPSNGELVWRGEIHGLQLVEIQDGIASIGQVSGKLPGVPCFVQPASKDVVISEAPRASNGFRRVVFRVKGNGVVIVRLSWAVHE